MKGRATNDQNTNTIQENIQYKRQLYWNITDNTESTADCNLSGSGPDSCWFYEEKYWGEEDCDRRPKTIIIMTIIIIYSKSWYRYSVCKKGMKKKWPVTK